MRRLVLPLAARPARAGRRAIRPMLGALLVLGVAAGTLALAPAPVAAAEGDLDLTGVDGVLAYTCHVGDGYDICLERPSTGEWWNITETPGVNESDPSWSPEGDRLVAVRWDPAAAGNHNAFQPAASELVTIDVSDPEDPTTTTTGITGFMPAWGSGGRIAFSRFQFPEATWNRAPIETVVAKERAAGGWNEVGVISPGGSQWIEPAWSPDGKHVVASMVRGQPAEVTAPPWAELYRLSPFPGSDSGELNLVVGNLEGNAVRDARQSNPGFVEGSFSPDGTQLVLVGCGLISLSGSCTFGSRRLAVMNSGGKWLPGLSDLTVVGEGARNPSWSPSGAHLAYTSSEGIKVLDLTTSSTALLDKTALGDRQPQWRPEPDQAFGIVTKADGAVRRAFTEAQEVVAQVNMVPAGAFRVDVCLFAAAQVDDSPGADAPLCGPGTQPAPLDRQAAILGGEEQIDVDLGQLDPGRYQLVARFQGAEGELRRSAEFAITCFSGSCDTSKLPNLVADLRAWADRLEQDTLFMKAACQALEYTMLVTSAARAVAGGASGIAFFLGGMVGTQVASAVFQGDIEKQYAQGAWKGLMTKLKTDNAVVAQQQMLGEAKADGSSAARSAEVFIEDEIKKLEEKRKAGYKKIATKFARQASAIPILQPCTLFLDQLGYTVELFRELADTLESFGPVEGAGFRGAGGFAPASMESLSTLLTSDLGSEPATIGAAAAPVDLSTLSEEQITDDAFAALNASLPVLLDLTAALGAIDGSTPRSLSTTLGDSVGAMAGFSAWLDLVPQLGAEVVRLTEEQGGTASGPLMSAEDAATLAAMQARVADVGLYDFERSAALAAGATEADLGDAVDELLSADSTLLTSLSAGEVAARLEDLADDLHLGVGRLALSMRSVQAGLWSGPQADDLQVTTVIGEATGFELPVFDPNGDDLTIEILSDPTHGTLQVFGTDVVYEPAPGFTGDDAFTYRASDGTLVSDVATIDIEVLLPAPTGTPDQYGLREGTTLTVPAPGVLGNDVSTALPLEARLVSPPQAGTVELAPNGSAVITVPTGTVGPLTFTYIARSAGSAWSQPVSVRIDVADQADGPVATLDFVITPEDTPVSIEPVANDADADGDPLTLTGFTQADHGSLSCTLAEVCTYTPDADFTGTDSFTYTISDGTGRSATGTVTIDVTPVADPPRAVNDTAVFTAGDPVVVDLLANDTHPDGLALTFVGATDPPQGTLVCDTAGLCTYTPDDDTV
ncbi:MAG: Ig-like domain-containing protein, partial [Acidimicrobiales bacterium]